MLEINNLTKFSVDNKSFAQVAKKVLIGENRETSSISLAFVSKEEIKKLNKKYRGKNTPTDVLAFGGIFNFQFSIFNKDVNKDLGEIVICPEVVKEKKEEIIKVFVHGILHLCGYDHEKSKAGEIKMQEKEDFYYLKLKI